MSKKLPTSLIPLLFFLFRPYKLYVLFLFLIAIFFGTIPTISAKFFEIIVDYVDKSDKTNGAEFLKGITKYAILFGLWWESINIFSRLYDYIYLKTLPKIKAAVFKRFYSHIQGNSQEFFQKNLAGFVSTRIADASRSVELIYSMLNEKVVVKIVSIISAVIGLYLIHQVFATIFVIWLVVFISLSTFWSSKVKRLSSEWATTRSMISGKIVDNISNISSIRTFNNFNHERRYIGHYVNKMIRTESNLQWFMLRLRYFLGISCSIMIFTMLYYLGVLKSNMEITAGAFAFVLSISNDITTDIWDFGQELGDLFEEIGTLNQSLDILSSSRVYDIEDAKAIKVNEGRIEFKNVSFSYIFNDNLFSNQSIIIKGGEKVGLVGFSGSGKTTFVNLITRLYDIQNGVITIDGNNINEVTQKSLRKNISIIPQDPILFNRSIYENITYGKIDASKEEVYEAAKKAHIHEDILKLEQAYDTICGDRGSNLSGGQRQRIIIARAILKNAPILILDEATSALDSVTEELIQKSLDDLMKGKTVLIIAHRLATLKNMDRVLVFERGHIVQDGSHNQLIKQGGVYLKLWESQVGGYILERPIMVNEI